VPKKAASRGFGAGSFGGPCYKGAYGKTPNFEEHLIFDKINDL